MSNLYKILNEKKICKSVWFMRQAGRYLPEFRDIRSRNTDFIKLCLNPELVTEITLQPINRFDLDSAIIFSDILMVPFALGQKVDFSKKQGPILSEFNFKLFLKSNKNLFTKNLNSVYKSIEITRKKLNKDKSLISFIGAPWTLLIYMLNLKKENKVDLEKLNSKDFKIKELIEELNEYLYVHIENQIKAGADVIQIFDSWAGLIPKENLRDYCFNPNLKLVEFCKKKNIPVICFPKGIKKNYKNFCDLVKPHGINLDYSVDPFWVKENIKNVVIQGGLDPKILLGTDEEIFNGATKYIQNFKDIPYVFNLGHGLLPETDPDKVNKLINFYRNFNG